MASIDLHLILEARRYATKLEEELNNSRKSHYEDVEQVRAELKETRSQLRDAYAKLDHLQSVLTPNVDSECEVPQKVRRS